MRKRFVKPENVRPGDVLWDGRVCSQVTLHPHDVWGYVTRLDWDYASCDDGRLPTYNYYAPTTMSGEPVRVVLRPTLHHYWADPRYAPDEPDNGRPFTRGL